MYKLLLFGLLFLISLSLIFNAPGLGNFELFYNFLGRTEDYSLANLGSLFAKYPPGVFALLSLILKFFSPESGILFYQQTAWFVHKFVLFAAYIFTWLALLHLTKSIKGFAKISLLDVSIAYFASVSILLASVALTYFDIFAAPFFLLSLAFAFRRKFNLSAALYLISLIFNWTLLIFAPLFFLFYKRSRGFSPGDLIPLFGFLVVPVLAIISYLLLVVGLNIGELRSLMHFNSSVLFGFPWFINQPFAYVLENIGAGVNLLGVVQGMFVAGISIATLGYLAGNIYFQNLNLGKKRYLAYLIPIVLFLLPLVWVDSLLPIFIFLFVLVYIRLYNALASIKNFSEFTFLMGAFSLYLALILFFPGLSEGALLWLALLSLVLFVLHRLRFTRLKLLLVNLLVFVNMFVFFGTAGLPPVRGVYFDLFRTVFAATFIIFAVWYISLVYKRKFSTEIVAGRFAGYAVSWMKGFTVLFLIFLNLSLIPATGSPDTVSWAQYTVATTNEAGGNPFLAQTLVDQRYPPLSTAILGFFSTTWKYFVGVSQTYALSTKLSIFAFYLLTVWAYLRFAIARRRKTLSRLDRLLVILTTFSLTVQTQGLADVNVYILPPLFAAIAALFWEKYFLSGILLGIAVSIKWQPVILVPLFGATLFHFRENLPIAIRRSLLFLAGFISVPLIAWALVLIQPGGAAAFARATDYLLHGAPMLSGQALNLNWIATYAIHIFQPERDVSLAHLGGLNRQIPTGLAPPIFQGSLFFLAAFIILLRYWLRQKKNIINFSAASVMIFFSHHILNKSAYEKHLFYTVALMLFLFLLRPTRGNRALLVLFDIMTVMNLVFFYGFTGDKWFNRLFLGIDITVIVAAYYVLIFAWVLWRYLRRGGLLFSKAD